MRRKNKGLTVFVADGDADYKYIASPAAKSSARAHFSCPTLKGLQLENDGEDGTALSHPEQVSCRWHKSIMDDRECNGGASD